MPGEKELTSGLSGIVRIQGTFETWVKKNFVIREEWSKTFSYAYRSRTPDIGLGTFSVDIYAYDGEDDTDWPYDELGRLLPNIRRVCTLAADLSGLQKSLTAHKGSAGQNFWMVLLSINVRFGGTALKTKMMWYEGVGIFIFPSTKC